MPTEASDDGGELTARQNGQRPSVLGIATLHRGCTWASNGMPHLSYLDYFLAPSLGLKTEA